MKLHTKVLTAAMAAVLFAAAPAFAVFNYTVNYADASASATYPATTTITTTNPLTFFTVGPGGSITGSATPTDIGLFTITPFSTAASGSFAVNESAYTATLYLQTVTNLDGSGPIGSAVPIIITGRITGTLGPDGDNTTISVLSGLPANGIVAGGITYDITLDSIRNPGVIGSQGNNGGVSLHVVAVPEPASLALLGIGALAMLAKRRLARSH